jgi:excisionase family DNA binding protein
MEDLYTVKEVASKLKVSERAVLDWLRAGQLRGLRVGRAWRVKESDLEAFLEAGPEKDPGPTGKGRDGRRPMDETHT